ncbi:MAG: NADPH:quinone oxidoreductase family protein [Acidimicrobiales bacterium]
MYAHKIVSLEGPDAVRWMEVPEPGGAGQVLVDVVAAGVSFADLLQTRGEYQMRPPLPYTPGMDAAGVVRSAPRHAGIEVGQRVAVLLRHGCWQEVVSAPVERVLALPEDVSFEAGAALALNYLTALFALTWRGRAQAGEVLVVHGASGGVGTAAVAVGRSLGLRTIAVASDEERAAFALRCGASDAVCSEGWLAAVRDLTGDRAVDIVFDPVGGERTTDNLRSLAPDGRLLVVGFAAGDISTVKVNRLLLGNCGVLGAASLEYFERRPGAVVDLWAHLLSLRGAGALPDPAVQEYAFDDAQGALRAIDTRRARGKIVLTSNS